MVFTETSCLRLLFGYFKLCNCGLFVDTNTLLFLLGPSFGSLFFKRIGLTKDPYPPLLKLKKRTFDSAKQELYFSEEAQECK